MTLTRTPDIKRGAVLEEQVEHRCLREGLAISPKHQRILQRQEGDLGLQHHGRVQG